MFCYLEVVLFLAGAKSNGYEHDNDGKNLSAIQQ